MAQEQPTPSPLDLKLDQMATDIRISGSAATELSGEETGLLFGDSIRKTLGVSLDSLQVVIQNGQGNLRGVMDMGHFGEEHERIGFEVTWVNGEPGSKKDSIKLAEAITDPNTEEAQRRIRHVFHRPYPFINVQLHEELGEREANLDGIVTTMRLTDQGTLEIELVRKE